VWLLVTLAGFVQEISPFGFGHVAMHHLTEYPFNRRFDSRVTLMEHREPPRGGDPGMHPEVLGLSGENLTPVSLAIGFWDNLSSFRFAAGLSGFRSGLGLN